MVSVDRVGFADASLTVLVAVWSCSSHLWQWLRIEHQRLWGLVGEEIERTMAMRKNMFWQGRRALGDEPNKMFGESLWRLWARRTEARLDRDQLWDMVEPYQRPKPIMPLVLLNIAAFYTGVVAAAVTEQLHKERYWAEHPGQAISIMKPMLYIGPYKVRREDFGEEARGQ